MNNEDVYRLLTLVEESARSARAFFAKAESLKRLGKSVEVAGPDVIGQIKNGTANGRLGLMLPPKAPDGSEMERQFRQGFGVEIGNVMGLAQELGEAVKAQNG